MTSKHHITLITTGGTIASRHGSDGVSVPVLSAAHLLDGHEVFHPASPSLCTN